MIRRNKFTTYTVDGHVDFGGPVEVRTFFHSGYGRTFVGLSRGGTEVAFSEDVADDLISVFKEVLGYKDIKESE